MIRSARPCLAARVALRALLPVAALGTAADGHAQGAAGDGSPPPALVAAAKSEAALTMYSSDDEGRQKIMLAGFEKRYGIKGTFLRLPTGPLMQRFSVEADAHHVLADIVSVSSPIPYESRPERFVALDAQGIPALARWPRDFVRPNYLQHAVDAVALVYNTDLLKPATVPKKWADLADPKWKGKFLLTDPQVADNYMGWLDAVERALGTDYLRKVAAQNYKVTPSGASGVQQVAAGAYSFNAPTFTAFSVPMIAKKAPIAIQYLTDPVILSPRSIGIAANAPHPNAARLYLNFMLSEEGMRLYCSFAPAALAGDPKGTLGCAPLRAGENMRFDVPEARKKALAQALGVAN